MPKTPLLLDLQEVIWTGPGSARVPASKPREGTGREKPDELFVSALGAATAAA